MLNKFRIFLAPIIFLAGIIYVSAAWTNPGPGAIPSGNNTEAPINVSSAMQTKNGNLFINGTLTSVFANITDQVFVTSDITQAPDTTALLDVDGQVRIRGPVGAFAPAEGKVLTAVDTTGLARWVPAPDGIAQLDEGFGIDLSDYSGPDGIMGTADDGQQNSNVTSISSTGVVAIDPSETQRKINDTCLGPDQAIKKINNLIIPNGTVDPSCQSFVTTVEAGTNSGLTLMIGGATSTVPTSGPVTLKINPGPGITINGSNQLSLNVNSGTGDGLQISSGQVKFESCASGQTWKYNTFTSSWECANFPSIAGDSVMYLKVRDDLAGNPPPPSCPAFPNPGWSPVPGISPLAYTSNENVGGGRFNRVRACYIVSQSCRVMAIRSSTSAGLPTCASFGIPAWSTAATTEEYAPGGVAINYVRTCYICN